VAGAIDGEQKKLRGRALEFGERVYQERPGSVPKAMQHRWKHWQRG
jgi:hypothetical protein